MGRRIPRAPEVFTGAALNDGTSNTLLVAERVCPPKKTASGAWHDDGQALSGWDNDTVRRPDMPPVQDPKANSDGDRYGSAHPGGFNMVLCDGAVRTVNYDVDLEVLCRYAHRFDGGTIANK